MQIDFWAENKKAGIKLQPTCKCLNGDYLGAILADYDGLCQGGSIRLIQFSKMR